MKKDQSRILDTYMLLTAVLFLAGFLMMVIFGARSYLAISSRGGESTESRLLVSYFHTLVMGNDFADAIEIRSTEYGDALVISDPDGYEIRVCSDGEDIYEQYCAAQLPLQLEHAQKIGPSKIFEPVLDGDCLVIMTDQGRVIISLRSVSGVDNGQ